VESTVGRMTFTFFKRDNLCLLELQSLYSSSSIIRIMTSRRIRWPGHVAFIEDKRNECRTVVCKPEGNRPPERTRYRWGDDIKVDLEI
jgi:hypothetical protein